MDWYQWIVIDADIPTWRTARVSQHPCTIIDTDIPTRRTARVSQHPCTIIDADIPTWRTARNAARVFTHRRGMH